MKILLIVLLFICLFSCRDFTDQQHYYVDPTLIQFVDIFYKEAALRGIHLSKDNLEVIIQELPQQNDGDVLGRADRNGIIVSIDKFFIEDKLGHSWNDKHDTLAVEYVMMHELAHHFLGRKHLSIDNYTIMTPDGWYANDYQTIPNKRKILLDELFH